MQCNRASQLQYLTVRDLFSGWNLDIQGVPFAVSHQIIISSKVLLRILALLIPGMFWWTSFFSRLPPYSCNSLFPSSLAPIAITHPFQIWLFGLLCNVAVQAYRCRVFPNQVAHQTIAPLWAHLRVEYSNKESTFKFRKNSHNLEYPLSLLNHKFKTINW